jgi:hypothetical protein
MAHDRLDYIFGSYLIPGIDLSSITVLKYRLGFRIKRTEARVRAIKYGSISFLWLGLSTVAIIYRWGTKSFRV